MLWSAVELRHLEVFLAITETGTLTAAAQRLHLVQSGISTTLRALESEIGAPLFTRTARQAVLTDVGEVLLPLARSTLATAAAARDVAQEAAGGLRGSLVVGVMSTMPLLNFPLLLARFHASHPHVSVNMRVVSGGSVGLLQALRAGELDLIFVAPVDDRGPDLNLLALGDVRLLLLLPREHPLADRETLSVTDLSAERWIDFPLGFSNRWLVDAAFARAGFKRNVALEVVDATSVPAYVEQGLGLAFIPEYVSFDDSRLATVPLTDGPLIVQVCLATSNDRPRRAVVAGFAAFVEAAAAAAFTARGRRPAP
jgi:DNA-binding transcriptional LysR family regulator